MTRRPAVKPQWTPAKSATTSAARKPPRPARFAKSATNPKTRSNRFVELTVPTHYATSRFSWNRLFAFRPAVYEKALPEPRMFAARHSRSHGPRPSWPLTTHEFQRLVDVFSPVVRPTIKAG